MPKNIVVCCDGTGNEFGDSNSNVVKLASTLARIIREYAASGGWRREVAVKMLVAL